jgi:hypothetical protein
MYDRSPFLGAALRVSLKSTQIRIYGRLQTAYPQASAAFKETGGSGSSVTLLTVRPHTTGNFSSKYVHAPPITQHFCRN